MELVALLSTGKGSWNEVNAVIEKGDWDKILLVGDEFARKFNSRKKSEFVQVDLGKDAESLKQEILSALKGKIDGVEVALNIASGSGREHIALISALLQIPAGIKFVSLAEHGLIEL